MTSEHATKRQTSDVSIFQKFSRMNPTALSMLSGVLVSAGINIYTTLFAGDVMPRRWSVYAAATVLTLASAAVWAHLAIRLDKAQRSAIANAPKDADWTFALDGEIEPSRNSIIVELFCAIFTGTVGLAILPYGIALSS